MLTTDAVPSASRPKRVLTASEKLRDSSNTAAPLLSSHRDAIEANLKRTRAEEVAKQLQASTESSIGTTSTPGPSQSQSVTDPADNNQSDSESEQQPREFCIAYYLSNSNTHIIAARKKTRIVIQSDDDEPQVIDKVAPVASNSARGSKEPSSQGKYITTQFLVFIPKQSTQINSLLISMFKMCLKHPK
jgi:hypothetical protein